MENDKIGSVKTLWVGRVKVYLGKFLQLYLCMYLMFVGQITCIINQRKRDKLNKLKVRRFKNEKVNIYNSFDHLISTPILQTHYYFMGLALRNSVLYIWKPKIQ